MQAGVSGWSLARAAGVLLCAVATPCAALAADAPPEPAQAAAASVTVLLQFELLVNGKPREPLSALRLYTAPLDAAGPPRLASPQAMAAPGAREAGWASLALEPGSHFLLVLPPGLEQDPPAVAYHAPSGRFGRLVRRNTGSAPGSTWNASLGAHVYAGAAPAGFEPLGGFLLQVPREASAVYAGTFSIECTGAGAGHEAPIGVCSEVSVSDRSADALALHDGAVAAMPASRYGTALLAADLRGEGLLTVTYGKSSAVRATAIGTTPATMPFAIIGASPAAAVVNLLMLAGVAATDAQRTREAAELTEKWRGCLEQLAAQTADGGFDAAVQKGAQAALEAEAEAARQSGPIPAAGDGPDFNLALELDPRQLLIVQCRESGMFCLEMGMRVTLRDLRRQRLALDALFVLGDALAPGDPVQGLGRLAQVRALRRPAPAPIENWCGGDRVARFKGEVEAAAAMIVRSALARATGH